MIRTILIKKFETENVIITVEEVPSRDSFITVWKDKTIEKATERKTAEFETFSGALGRAFDWVCEYKEGGE